MSSIKKFSLDKSIDSNISDSANILSKIDHNILSNPLGLSPN